MTIGFIDSNGNQRTPDNGVTKTVKPITKGTTFADGYEQRFAFGLNNLEERYSVAFTNRSAEEIQAIINFLDQKKRVEAFTFTLPNDNEVGGELDILVVAEPYSVQYFNEEIYSLTCEFLRVYEQQNVEYLFTDGFGSEVQQIEIFEGDSTTLSVSTKNVPDGTNLFFVLNNPQPSQGLRIQVNTASNTVSSGVTTGSITALVGAEEALYYQLQLRTGSSGGPVVKELEIKWKGTFTGSLVQFTNSSFSPVTSIVMNEGSIATVYVEGTNTPPATYYWELASASTADFLSVSGTVATSGTSTLNSGLFSIATLNDLTLEGTENFTLRLRSGSVGGPILDTLNVQVNDTSTPPASIDIAQESVTLLTNESSSLTVDSTNVVSSNAYWRINSGFGKFSADQGTVSLTPEAGSPSRKTGSFSVLSTDDNTSTTYTLDISENASISPVRDTVTINTGSGRFTDGAGNDISAVVFGTENSTAVVNVEAAGIDPSSVDLYWSLEPGNAVYYSRASNPDTVDFNLETLSGTTWSAEYPGSQLGDTYYFYGAFNQSNQKYEIYCIDHTPAPEASPTLVGTVFSESITAESSPFPSAGQGIQSIQFSGNTLLVTIGIVSKLWKITTANGLWTDAVTVSYSLPDKPERVYWEGDRYAIIPLLDRTCKLWDTQTNAIVGTVADTDVVDFTQVGRSNVTDTVFGHRVSISGDYAAIGTRFEPDTSSLYQDVCIFNISSGSFDYISTLDGINLYGPGSQGSPIAPSSSSNRDDFGLYFVLDGDYIYVTASAEQDAASPGLYRTPLIHCIRTQNNWGTSYRLWSRGPQGITASNKVFYPSYFQGLTGDTDSTYYPLLQVSGGILWVTVKTDVGGTAYPFDAFSGYLLSDTSDGSIDIANASGQGAGVLAVSGNKVLTSSNASLKDTTISAPIISLLTPTLSNFSTLTGNVTLSGTTTASSGTFTVTSLPDGTTETAFPGQSLFYNLYLRTGSVTGNIIDVLTLEIPDDSIGPEDALFVTTNNSTRQVYDSITLPEGDSFNFYIEKRNIATGNITWFISPQNASLFVDDEATVSYAGSDPSNRFPVYNTAQQTITANSGLIFQDTSFRIRATQDLVGDISNLISAIDLTVVIPTAELLDSEDTPILETFMTEGSTETIKVKTQYRTDTTLYWTLESATTADFLAVAGNFPVTIVDGIGTGTFDIQTLADSTTESQESYTLNLRETSTSGTIIDTITLYVDDTSQGLVKYQFTDVTVSPNIGLTTLNIDESNSSYLIGIQTEQVAAGTTLYWTIEDSSTLEFNSISGSVVTVGTLTEALATFSITTKADLLTEGTQTKRLYIRLGSETGTPLNVLFLNISDTSTSAAVPPGQYHTISSTDYVNIDTPFGTSSASFGKGIDFKSGRLAISAPGATLSPPGAFGAVSLYTYYNTVSPLVASSPDKIYTDVTLKNPTGLSADIFGNTLHFSKKANKLAVTAPGKSSNVGALYIYDLQSSPITFYTFAPESSAYNFGTASAYSDYSERLVVTFETGSTVAGKAYIYSLPDDTAPSEISSITGPSQNDGFGSSVAIYNTTIAIGAPNATVSAQTNQGKVYVYSISGDLLHTIDGPVVQPANFGESVALYLNKLAVFAKTDGAVADVGSVYIYDITASPATLIDTITIPAGFSPNTNRFFGQTLELNGNKLFISFYNGYEGACVEYDLAASQFVNLFENKLPVPTSSDQFYQTLAYRPPFLFAGHPGADSTFSSPAITVTDVGAVQAYKTTDEEVDFTSTSQYYLTIPGSPGQDANNTLFGSQAIANDNWYVTRSNQTNTPIYLVYDTSTSPFSFVGSFQGSGQTTQWMDIKGDLFAVVECNFIPTASTVRRLDIYNLATLTNIYQIDDDQAGTSPINDGISQFSGGVALGNNRFWHLSEKLATPKRIFERDYNGVLISTIDWDLNTASFGNSFIYSIAANDRYLFAFRGEQGEQLTIWRIGEYDSPWADYTNLDNLGNSSKIQVYKNYLIFNPEGQNLGDDNGIVWTSDSGTWRDLRPYLESRNIQSDNSAANTNRPENDPPLLGRYFPTKQSSLEANSRLYDVFTNKIVQSYSDTAQSTTNGLFSAINSTHVIWAYPSYDYTAAFPNTKGAISVHRLNPPEEALVLRVNTFISDQTGEGSWRFYVSGSNGVDPINVDWGDGTSSTPSSSSYATHTYSIPGVYTVKITGTGAIRANQSILQDGDDKVISVENWGSAYTPESSYSMFKGYTRLEYVNSYGNVDWSGASQMPDMFKGCSSLRYVNNKWNLNGVTQTFSMFEGCSSFTGIGIEEWDMSTVVSLTNMFKDCTSFSADLSSWNTSSASKFLSLFENCSMNFSVATWTNNIQSADKLTSMFKNAKNFNSALFTTLPAAETSLQSFLEGASSFNDPSISSLSTTNISDYNSMFKGAYSFNQPLSTWNTAAATDMVSMFQDAIVFDQNISGWNVENIPLEPLDFSTGAPLQNVNKPNWGVSPFVGLGITVDTTVAGTSGASNFRVQVSSADPTLSDPITIDWGDGNSDTPTGDITHTYSVSGTYNIDITGAGAVLFSDDREKITKVGFAADFKPTTLLQFMNTNFGAASTFSTVSGTINLSQWGVGETNSVGSLSRAFDGQSSLVSFENAWSAPTNTSGADNMFRSCTSLTNPKLTIDTSTQTSNGFSCTQMFQFCNNMNYDVSGWDMTNVTGLNSMFRDNFLFNNGNQPLSWTFTGNKVSNMNNMFGSCSIFTGSGLSSWVFSNNSGGINMSSMFANTNLTEDLSSWGTTPGQGIYEAVSFAGYANMFQNCSNLNFSINGWDMATIGVTSFSGMFSGCSSWNNGSLAGVNNNCDMTANISTFGALGLFTNCAAMNCNFTGTWVTTNMARTPNVFKGCTTFNGTLPTGWDMSAVTEAYNMFEGASAFNQNISGWDMSSCVRLERMFEEADAFDQDISGWNVDLVVSASNAANFSLNADQKTNLNWTSAEHPSNATLGNFSTL